ncbi:hypothetical protein GCM10025856_13310 [Methylophaga marina]|uniref:type I restriction endonuclease n=1 Tax=Methylophaga marina TaxID=45495 RepID=UPI00257353E0|nr:hypothetical protein [Methylophaga marina]BDZ73612.1 hypothetical protein GCM10025856_13310 [Methylophaga marina]
MSRTEAQTRTELIDQQLEAAGWNVKDPTHVVEEFDITMELSEGVREARTKYEGHQFSDYVLLGKDGKPLAVVEAKKPAKMRPSAGNKQSNTVTTFRNSWEVNSFLLLHKWS